MNMRHGALYLIIAVLVLFVTGFANAAEPFSVEVVDVTRSVPLGVSARAVVRVVNSSGKPQRTAFLHAELRLNVVDGPPEAMHCLATSRFEGPGVDHYFAGLADLVRDRKAEVPAGWATEVPRSFLPPEPGEYTVVFRFSMTAGTEPLLGEPEDNWVGEVSSAPVKVRVLEPQGEDAEAFEFYSDLVPEDYCCSRARRFNRAFDIPLQKAEWADLVRRFPDSVYAADYVVRRLLQIGVLFLPADKMFWDLSRDIDGLKGTVPCPPPERCPDGGTIFLRGADYIGWKLAWCERILEHHPDVWFADNVRYMAAAYRCRLSDKDACAAGLADLAEHGKPYVATKAAELLAALKAQGMLEEKGK